MSGLGDDFAGLDEFGSDGSKGGPRLRKLEAKDGVSAMDQLRNVLSVNFKRVIELFRDWDDDGNQQVSKLEFRRALPVLGITISREDAEALFDEFDADGSGEIDYKELAKQLRVGLTEGIELDAALQAGAMGEIETERTQGFELRSGLNENASKVFGTSLDIVEGDNASIIDQLMRALGAPGVMARVIDIFRAWDDDGSGTVSKREFGRALPMLGLHVDKKQAGELFDVFDDDQSGSIDYAEINKKLRKRVGKVDRKPKLLPKINKGVNRDEKSGAVSAARYQQVKSALAEELTTKRQLQRLKNQVARMERQEAQERNKAARADQGAALRKEIDRRVGRDLLERIQSVPMASQEEMVSLAEQLQGSLDDHRSGSWFLLFREMDEDGSGRISYSELKSACRKILNLTQSSLPDSKLQSVWRALDEDASGFISTGEFGRFMRLAGKAEQTTSVRKTAKAAEEVDVSDALAIKRLASGAADGPSNISKKLASTGLSKANDEEMNQVSKLWNSVLNRLPPDSREWYHLFKQMDVDGSGLVDLGEFERTVREVLRLGEKVMPQAKMHRIWLRLDENLNGTVDAGEFGRFMRLHLRTVKQKEKEGGEDEEGMTKAGHRLAAGGSVAHKAGWRPIGRATYEDINIDEEEEMSMKSERERAEEMTRMMKEEAMRLEALLKGKGKGSSPNTSPGAVKLPPITSPNGAVEGGVEGEAAATTGSGSAKTAPELAGGVVRRSGRRQRPSAGHRQRLPPIDVLRAYGQAPAGADAAKRSGRRRGGNSALDSALDRVGMMRRRDPA